MSEVLHTFCLCKNISVLTYINRCHGCKWCRIRRWVKSKWVRKWVVSKQLKVIHYTVRDTTLSSCVHQVRSFTFYVKYSSELSTKFSCLLPPFLVSVTDISSTTVKLIHSFLLHVCFFTPFPLCHLILYLPVNGEKGKEGRHLRGIKEGRSVRRVVENLHSL